MLRLFCFKWYSKNNLFVNATDSNAQNAQHQ